MFADNQPYIYIFFYICIFCCCAICIHSEKSLARSMLFYSRNSEQQNWVQFVLYINNDCMYIADLWLQLWLKNHCKNIAYYSIIQLTILLLLNNYEYNCNNSISSVSVVMYVCVPFQCEYCALFPLLLPPLLIVLQIMLCTANPTCVTQLLNVLDCLN